VDVPCNLQRVVIILQRVVDVANDTFSYLQRVVVYTVHNGLP